ncbi:MAG: tetratricopeptide repeat protein [Bacteroidaceae bacterium]|nr:tetratricopeptide repeat protein [Bacteroidaceae bacterium]MDE6159118.1 tetratricopeptide repeat protein [Bacteroidaceae bacterium]
MSKSTQKPVQVSPEEEAKRKKTQKNIITYIAVVLVLGMCIGGFFGYRDAQGGKASKAMFAAEEQFENDRFDVVVKGDSTGKSMSMVAVADKYGSTEAGNLAKLYVGLAYAQQGKLEEAKKYLEKFDAQDDEMVSNMAKAALGNVYVSLGDKEKGAKTLEKAAKDADNVVVSPLALIQAGEVYEALGNKEKALEVYTLVKTKYANSPQSSEIDKYIERVNASK